MYNQKETKEGIMSNKSDTEKYLEKFNTNINFVLKNKSNDFRGEHQPKFEAISASLETRLNDEFKTKSPADRTLAYTIHMAQFRRVARSLGLMKPRTRHRSRR